MLSLRAPSLVYTQIVVVVVIVFVIVVVVVRYVALLFLSATAFAGVKGADDES